MKETEGKKTLNTKGKRLCKPSSRTWLRNDVMLNSSSCVAALHCIDATAWPVCLCECAPHAVPLVEADRLGLSQIDNVDYRNRHVPKRPEGPIDTRQQLRLGQMGFQSWREVGPQSWTSSRLSGTRIHRGAPSAEEWVGLELPSDQYLATIPRYGTSSC